MIFTEIEGDIIRALCTLSKLSENTDADDEVLITIGQNLGVPRDTVIEILDDWEESDLMLLESQEEKRCFLNTCFSYMDDHYNPTKAEWNLYHSVKDQLGVSTSSNN